MRNRFVLALVLSFFFAVGVKRARGVAPAPTPWEDPESNTGALKGQVVTGGSYSAHSGNASRTVNDLHVPDALGTYGLDFTRYWNSLHNEETNLAAEWPRDFGASGWSHSWQWNAVYDDELPDMENDPPPHIFVTSITITFPDGHATKFKISRTNANPRVGPPYSGTGETTLWPKAGYAVHDRLAEMAPDGHEFWLYRADGGAVHFVGLTPPLMHNGHALWTYEAREVFDPYGFRTDLIYQGGRLWQVVQEGGRSLILTWGWLGGLPVITKVETGGPAAGQQVNYYYSKLYAGTGAYTLALAQYQDEPVLGQTASAHYAYSRAFGDDPNGTLSDFPVLKSADDPHFDGAMTKIRYKYRGLFCEHPEHPPSPLPEHYYSWFYFEGHAIEEERSGETGIMVSRFDSPCHDGRREDYNGIGGWRSFNFGDSADDPEVDSIYGYQLTKLTDFGRVNDPPASRPFRKQAGGAQPGKVWDGRNIRTNFEYLDESGSPSKAIYTDGSFCTYDRTNQAPSVAPDPQRIRNKQRHWLFSKRDENNQRTVYRRDSRRRVTDIYYHDAAGTQVASESYTYNDLNQVTTHTLPSGVVQHYDYDGLNRLAREWNPVDRAEHGPIADRVYTCDALGRVAMMLEGRAATANAPFTVRMTYNGRHQVLSVESASPNGQYPTVRYEYDKYGNCTAITNELGHRSTFTYDSYRRCTSMTEQLNAPGWNGSGIVPSRRWDWIYDREVDGVGMRPASSHTSKEWRIQIEPAFNDTGGRRMTARSFDVNNRIRFEQTGWIQPPGEISPNNPWYPSLDLETHSFAYDGNGQKSSFTDPRGRITTYDYDVRNRLWKTNETINTPLPRTTETLYDRAGNKLSVKFPDQNMQHWENYDPFGQPGRFIDENNHPTDLTYRWGPMKKLATVTTYREKDNPPGGTETQLTSFDYDGMGRPTWTIFPDTTSELSTYKLGQLDAFKTRRDQTKRLHYDARGREDYHTWDSGAAPGINRVWDDANRLTSISNVFSTIDYGYDDAGQVKREGNQIAGTGATETRYCRYPSGEVSRLTYPNGTVVTRHYTARGQLGGVGWGSGSTSYAYLHDGKVDYQAFGGPGWVWTKFEYNGRGMIESVAHRNGGSQNLASREYWRDNRDRIEAWKRGTDNSQNGMEDGRGDRYHYDAEGQLDRASYRVTNPESSPGPAVRADIFTYDELGNRRQLNHIASMGWMNLKRRDNGLNQYREWENNIPWPDPNHWGSGIFHDDNVDPVPSPPWISPGNGVVMQDGYITGSFNALNQPVGIWSFAYWGTSNWMFFGYDPLGRCVKQWVGPHVNNQVPPANTDPATYFYYDGWNLIQEVNSANNTARHYVHGGRVDEIVASAVGGTWLHHHYDARGHCILLTDTGGNIIEQYDYDAFGRAYFYDRFGNDIGSSPWENRFLFTGREWISDLRLYDYRARMYQPELGRFLQPDPKHFAAGDYNLYRYCHNDPINKSDPTGLASTEIIAKIVKFLRGVKDSEKTVAEVKTMKDAVRALKEGEDVRFKSEKLAREGAKQAGEGKTPIKETDRFGKHYHDAERRGGHALFGSAGVATIRDALPPNASSFERGGAAVLDFFNPILIINDVIELGKSVPITTIPNSSAPEKIDYAP
jgi:RHS repeat-associated protein